MPKIITYIDAGQTISVHITDKALAGRTLTQIAAAVVPQGLSWTEVQEMPATPLQERRDRVWARVKMERAKRQDGGVLVSGHWFQSDQTSRIQLMRLDSKAFAVLAGGGAVGDQLTVAGQPLQWKTWENGLVPMTVGLAQTIASAVEILDAMAFTRGEVLRAQITASADPESIDITTGWPAIYTGA